MRFDWDDQKSQLLKQKRGYFLEEIAVIFTVSYVERMKNDDPEQFIAIGYCNNNLLSVIYEIRYDEEGEYIWLVTYWKSTKQESKLYEQYFN
ncbi:hypothetical protein [Aphanothece sacrum]|uniref:BrnT family toxin n=1 Tax=Aphanothece sacrum FPU1 TaxID=1920663 RepID=A0A401IED2_APHSA|nr:hypothetical protein [Aphanothece sacrum]GBF79586.1 hypothetical protein AsFPU1_0982 [Aphanothece sacrum FPU1]GBF87045.1 hypothetical protein AsFPU3_4124 [Aphanothece sacrum FPU3]